MNTTHNSKFLMACLSATLVAAGCASDDATSTATTASSPTTHSTTSTPTSTWTPTTTTAPTPTDSVAKSTSTEPTPTSTSIAATVPAVVSAALQREVDVLCDPARFADVPITGGDPQRVGDVLAFLDADGRTVPPIDSIDVPPEFAAGFALVMEAATAAREALDAAEAAAAAGDLVEADRLVNRHFGHLRSVSGRLAMMGATCGFHDPVRAASPDLTVALDLAAEQPSVGYGSVWVSQKLGDDVVRIDPATGEIVATIDVGDEPLKLQPADGRMWVRTRDAYVAIDAATDEVVAALAKADVGPAANRNYAVDGAMWICDGPRLHRYDTTTLEPVATIDLDFDCAFVYATDNLVVAWNDNDEPGESGESAAVFVDPTDNQVLASMSLPIDVGWPAVFDETVFFGGDLNSAALVIDRATWLIESSVELPDVVGGGGGIVTDGTSIYVPTRGAQPYDVLVIDAETLEVTETLTPLSVSSLALADGSLWVADSLSNVLHRFDVG